MKFNLVFICLVASTFYAAASAQERLPAVGAGCLPALRPFSGECSGHGSCINETCICDPGWSGIGLFLDRRGRDCSTNDTAFKVCQAITYGAHVVAAFIALGRILRLGKLLICFRKQKLHASQRGIRKVQMLVVSHLTVSLSLVFQFAIFTLGSLYIPISVLAAIATILTAFAQAVDVAVQATFFITASISSLHVSKASSAKRKLLVLVYIQQAVYFSAWIICMIGIYAGPTEYQLGFYYGVTITTLIVQVIPPFFHAKFLGQALQALEEHMQTNKTLSNSESANSELLDRVRAKIEKARGNSVGPAVIAAIVILCVIVMPPLASYMVPLMWALTALRLTADNIIYAPEN